MPALCYPHQRLRDNAFAGVPMDVRVSGYVAFGRAMREVGAEQDIFFIARGAWGVEGRALDQPGAEATP